MRKLIILAAALSASPAMAASGPFFSLSNTNFVVLLAFIVFLGILVYFKVPRVLGDMLDKRAVEIKGELEEARQLREEAQSLLASYERKQKEVQDQADRIVASAKSEAEEAAVQAKADLQKSIARRLQAAEEQIASAEAAAVREVRDSAITAAIGAAQDILAKQMSAEKSGALIDKSIDEVKAKLH